MTRSKRQNKVPPTPLTHIRRMEEANVGRLGLISIQERIPDTYTSWTIDFMIEGHPARLSCDALPKYGGVPHGLDGDIATALIDLYIESGAPKDGVLRTTAYQILKRAGLDDSGRYYTNLRQTLYRLRTATYSASEAWRDHFRNSWTTVTFNYLEALEFSSEDDELGLSRASVLKVRLAEPIVRSILAEYTKPLDLEFLTSLDRPLTRALYRLLDARRYAPDHLADPLPSFTVNLIEWAEACKIVDQRSNKVRATLQGAHQDLIERQYLASVDYEGRGSKQLITYSFVTQDDPVAPSPPSPAVEALTARRVSAAVARRLVETFGEGHVLERLRKFQHLLEQGYKARNASALLVDVIRDQENKYPDPEGFVTPEQQKRVQELQVVRQQAEADQEEARQRAMSAEERIDGVLKTLQFLLRDRLTTADYAKLRARLMFGWLDAQELSQRVTRAKLEGKLDRVVAELVRTLNTPDLTDHANS